MEKEIKEKLVKQLYNYRIEKKLTLKQLSDELDLPLTTVANWLQGANYPSVIAAEMLKKFLTMKGYDTYE